MTALMSVGNVRSCTCVDEGYNRCLASFSTSLNFEPPAFKNAARYPNAETNLLCRNDRPMSPPSLVKLGPRTPENRLVKVPHPLKLYGENVQNHQSLSRRLFDYAQILHRV